MSSYRRDDVPPPVVTPAAARLSKVLAIGVFQRQLVERLNATSISNPASSKRVEEDRKPTTMATTGADQDSASAEVIDLEEDVSVAGPSAAAPAVAPQPRGAVARRQARNADAPALRQSHTSDAERVVGGWLESQPITMPRNERAAWTKRADERKIDEEVYKVNRKDYLQMPYSGERPAVLGDAPATSAVLRPGSSRMPDTGPANPSRGALTVTQEQPSERNDRWRKGLPEKSKHYESYKETVAERALRMNWGANDLRNLLPLGPYPTLASKRAELLDDDAMSDDVSELFIQVHASREMPYEDSAYSSQTGWNLRMCPWTGHENDLDENTPALQNWVRANAIMDDIIESSQHLVEEEKYFSEEWDFAKLEELRGCLPDNGVDKDLFLAKFMIQTHLVCLDMVSEQTRVEGKGAPTDGRMKMVEAFDLPSLVVNVKKLLQYRMQVLHARQQMFDANGNFKQGADLDALEAAAKAAYDDPESLSPDVEMLKSRMMIHQELYNHKTRNLVRDHGRAPGDHPGGNRRRRSNSGEYEEDDEYADDDQDGPNDDGGDEDDDDDDDPGPQTRNRAQPRARQKQPRAQQPQAPRRSRRNQPPRSMPEGGVNVLGGVQGGQAESRKRLIEENERLVKEATKRQKKLDALKREMRAARTAKLAEVIGAAKRRKAEFEAKVAAGEVEGDDQVAMALELDLQFLEERNSAELENDHQVALALQQEQDALAEFTKQLKANAVRSEEEGAGPSTLSDNELDRAKRKWLEGIGGLEEEVKGLAKRAEKRDAGIEAKKKEQEEEREPPDGSGDDPPARSNAAGKRRIGRQIGYLGMEIGADLDAASAGEVMGEEEGQVREEDGMEEDDMHNGGESGGEEHEEQPRDDPDLVKIETIVPAELPMRCCAPPRQGKSALIWLMSSFAIKLGGTVLCGVAPNKKIPIAEMVDKLEKNLQWTDFTRKSKKKKRRGRDVEETEEEEEKEDDEDDEDFAARVAALKAKRDQARRQEGEAPPNRYTHQGLEVAMAWAVDESNVPMANTRKQRREANQLARQTPCPQAGDADLDDQPAAPPGLLKDDQRGTLLWKRLRAKNTLVRLSNNTTINLGKMVNADKYNEVKEELGRRDEFDALIGDVWKMMKKGEGVTKTHVFLYSQDTERDTLGAQQVAHDLLRSTQWAQAGYKNTEDDNYEWTRQWVFHVRDEAQFLCKQSAFVEDYYTCGDGDRYYKLVKGNPLQEHMVGWKHPPIILDQLRTTYPLMRGLSMCVSGTLLPSIAEKQLWGEAILEKFHEDYPKEDESAATSKWGDYYAMWDKTLVRAAETANSDRHKNPFLESSLVPPKGRMADVASMPAWIRHKDPENVDRSYTNGQDAGRAPGRTYYGTMQHVVEWEGVSAKLDRAGGNEVNAAGVAIIRYDHLIKGRQSSEVQDPWGLGTHLSPGMSVLDQAHPSVGQTALRKEITNLHAAYQQAWRLLDVNGNKIEHPLQRLALLKLEQMNADAWQSFFKIDPESVAPPGLSREELTTRYPRSIQRRESDSRLRLQACAASAALKAKGLSQKGLLSVYTNAIRDFRLRLSGPDRAEDVARPFSHDLEYFRFCGLHYYTPTKDLPTSASLVPDGPKFNRVQTPGGNKLIALMPYRRPMALPLERPSADAIKILCHVKEWLDEPVSEVAVPGAGNENVLSQVFSPMYILSPTRLQNNDDGGIEWARHALKYAWLRMHKDFLLAAPTMNEKGVVDYATGSPNHPYVACKSVEEFRRKYGAIALVYASDIKQEQALRAAVLADVASTTRSFADAYAPSTTQGTSKQSGDGEDDGRLLSLLFDPALPENRLPQYGPPPVSWTVNEKRTMQSSMQPNPDPRTQRDGSGMPPDSAEYTTDDQKTDIQNVFNWLDATRQRHDFATNMAEGTMLNVAHAYRLEPHWTVEQQVGDDKWKINLQEDFDYQVQMMGEYRRRTPDDDDSDDHGQYAEKNPDCAWQVSFVLHYTDKIPIDFPGIEKLMRDDSACSGMGDQQLKAHAPDWVAKKANDEAKREVGDDQWVAYNATMKRKKINLQLRKWSRYGAYKNAYDAKMKALGSHMSDAHKQKPADTAGIAASRGDALDAIRSKFVAKDVKRVLQRELLTAAQNQQDGKLKWVFEFEHVKRGDSNTVQITVTLEFNSLGGAQRAKTKVDALLRDVDDDTPSPKFHAVFNYHKNGGLNVVDDEDGDVSFLSAVEEPYYVQYDFDTRAGAATGSKYPFGYVKYAAPNWEQVDKLGRWHDTAPNHGGHDKPSGPFTDKPKDTPLEDLNGIVLRLSVTKWKTAGEALIATQKKYNIHRTLVSGYGMLTAGLTIQTSLMRDPEWTARMLSDPKVGTVDIHWIPRYMSMSAADPGAIDTQYQIMGRSFVDTRFNQLPDGWKVNFLGARTTYPMVKLYSRLELRFAQIENTSLTAALATLIQMMTHPDVAGDDYSRTYMHDVVSAFLNQHMHVSERANSMMFKFLKAKQLPFRGPPIPIGGPRVGFAWHLSMPQHWPKDDDHVVKTQ
jgi:hypothetical protein